MSRRTWFFLLLGAICLVMIPPTPSEFRVLNVVMAGLAFFWAIALALEDVSLGWRRGERRDGDGPVRRA